MPRPRSALEILKAADIQPSAQRLAVADYVLFTDEHPSAERVFTRARKALPMLSRATVYNTLNLFVRKGILRELVFAQGNAVFDPNIEPHHHLLDETTGRIHDVPWEALEVKRVERLRGFEVRDYQVVLTGRPRPRAR